MVASLVIRIYSLAISPYVPGMKPFSRAWFVGAALFLALALPTQALPKLKISPDHRHLVKEDGAPFFYLGDTAWELFHRLNREEAAEYLANRAAKGFTVIHSVVLAEFDGLTAPNAFGNLPLTDNDPTKPNEAYFKNVDEVVALAESKGLYIGMLPTWGDKFSKKWGVGPEIFTPANAEIYGEFLGKRYQDKAIVWILGGDRSPENDQHLAIIRAMAKGIKKGDAGSHLITYHPQGNGNSSKWFNGDDWLDFNMFQSGHSNPNSPNYNFNVANYKLSPAKPTLDGEPRYEDHPINWKPELGWFDDFDVRQAAYWSMLSGACGHVYGNHNIWQFLSPARKPVSSARTQWRTAIDQPGALQMKHLRTLFEARPWQKLVPDQSVIVGDAGTGIDHIRAARAEDGSFLFIYSPTGKPVTVKFDKISAPVIRSLVFDPRVGLGAVTGLYTNRATQLFQPLSSGRGNDWVLIIEDASKQFSIPGVVPKKR
jgi:hypothetical protein